MSNQIAAYQQAKIQAEEAKKALEALEANPEFQKMISFRNEMEELMAKYELSTSDVVSIIAPEHLAPAKTAGTRTRKPRATKVYVNPNTDERIETRGGNHNTLKAWKQEFGAETVESWLVEVIDHAEKAA